MSDIRKQKINSLLRNIISDMIVRGEIKDPRVNSMISITRIKLAKDNSSATVWISGYMPFEEVEKSAQALNHGRGFIQRFVGKRLKLRTTPKLTFIADSGIKEGFEITRLIDGIDD